jgi:hypothetical protein
MKTIQRSLIALTFMAFPAFASDGIAFITNMKGEVAVDGSARPVLLAELARGQRLSLGRDSQASVMFIATGKEYLLKGPGDYLVKETEVAGSSGIPPVARSTEWRASTKVLAQVAQTSAASVRMRSVAKPKADDPARVAYPSGGSIATLQPAFRWLAPTSPSPQDFALTIAGEAKPVHLGRTTGATYKVPGKLKPDTDYAWSVSSATGEVGSGSFRTLSTEALQRLDRAKPTSRSDFSDRVLFALLLHEMGAVQDAREMWSHLAEERTDLPELSALAK